MVNRAAFFADKQDVEAYFKIESERENLFQPHYNISIGHSIPVITGEGKKTEVHRLRWGEQHQKGSSAEAVLVDDVPEELAGKKVSRCVVPLSGFYIWKDKRENDHPFFVRMIEQSLMAVAGLLYEENESYFRIIETDSNALIHPMSEKMPLMLNQKLALDWLNNENETGTLLKEAQNLFLLTDISVVRVQKKVNDPSINEPSLVQPIPK